MQTLQREFHLEYISCPPPLMLVVTPRERRLSMQALKRVFQQELLLPPPLHGVSCPPSRKAALHTGVEEGVFHLVYTPILPLSSPDQDILKSKPMGVWSHGGSRFCQGDEKTNYGFFYVHRSSKRDADIVPICFFNTQNRFTCHISFCAHIKKFTLQTFASYASES
jgi:hypothetical protein